MFVKLTEDRGSNPKIHYIDVSKIVGVTDSCHRFGSNDTVYTLTIHLAGGQSLDTSGYSFAEKNEIIASLKPMCRGWWV